MKMFSFFYFSHHPLCKNYRKEVFGIRGHYFCKGCSEVYGSVFLTIVLTFMVQSLQSFNLYSLLIIAILSILPSVIGNFYHFKIRIIKDFIRIILGIGLGIALSQVFFSPTLEGKIIVLVMILIAYFLFLFTRTRLTSQHQYHLCPNCEQFNDQACSNYRRVFNAEGQYSRIISDYIQKKISSGYMMNLGYQQTLDD